MNLSAAFTIPVLPALLAATGRGTPSSQMALIVVIVGVSVLMLVSTRRRIMIRNSNSPRAYVREQIAQIKEERQVSQEVCAVLQELENLARQVNAQMDCRSAKLEALIRAADERIDRLTRLTVAGGEPAAPAPPTSAAPTPLSARQATLRRLVRELSDLGYNTLEIANRVGLTAGEVELILALRLQTSTPT